MSEIVPQGMESSGMVQQRSLCTWTGIAIGFRVFFAVMVDGAQLFSGGWIAVLMAGALALPIMLALKMMRCAYPDKRAVQAFESASGVWVGKISMLLLFLVLIYDCAAVLRLMSGTAKYVAMPEGNGMIIMAVTMLTAVLAALPGVRAAANAAVLWKKLMLVLIGMLIVFQLRYFQGAWLFPILGRGIKQLARESIPPAGIFCFAAGGWLMMEPQHDQKGQAMMKNLLTTALSTAAIALLFAMLIPGMLQEPPVRSFRIGRLLMNDRSGLSLEMPYVVLIYAGMLTMLIFELNAAAAAMNLCIKPLKRKVCLIAAGLIAFSAAAGGIAERQVLRTVSMWYYPLLAAPIVFAGIRAWIGRRKAQKGSGE